MTIIDQIWHEIPKIGRDDGTHANPRHPLAANLLWFPPYWLD
jgi:hypothetical protein